MKLHYYPETDSLSIEFSGKPGADAEEIAEGVGGTLMLRADGGPHAPPSGWSWRRWRR